MSDTPRTDSMWWYDEDEIPVVSLDFARALERELNLVLQSLESLQAMNAQLQLDLEQRDADYENLQNLM